MTVRAWPFVKAKMVSASCMLFWCTCQRAKRGYVWPWVRLNSQREPPYLFTVGCEMTLRSVTDSNILQETSRVIRAVNLTEIKVKHKSFAFVCCVCVSMVWKGLKPWTKIHPSTCYSLSFISCSKVIMFPKLSSPNQKVLHSKHIQPQVVWAWNTRIHNIMV